jgi:glycosyltransferase involved in cell wall biosynthesis
LNLPVPLFISVIIPNHNGEKTIGRCLDAAFASQYSSFEVIVVDDCSADSSTDIIDKYPCRLIRLPEHGGASKARNTGAQSSTGEVLFFIDGDCLLQSDTLAKAAAAYQEEGPEVIIGGTYTLLPYDQKFFSIFQSTYIHYSETKNTLNPDYVATHAMLIAKDLFQKSGGFNEQFMPILEDVEFSHRLKKMSARLRIVPEIQVQHIFNFTAYF